MANSYVEVLDVEGEVMTANVTVAGLFSPLIRGRVVEDLKIRPVEAAVEAYLRQCCLGVDVSLVCINSGSCGYGPSE